MTHPNDRPRLKHNGRFQASPGTDARAAHAAQLRADNPGMTYQQIADAVGYSNKGDCWRAVQRCREAVLREAGADLVASEAQLLDDLFVSAMEILERDHVMVSHGRIVKDDTGTPLLDDGPRLAALRELRAIRESYRKLHGVDQPAKVEHSGGVKFEIVGVDPQDLV
ncbi:hypothetical protein ACFVHR_04810 [Streptomyces sp. NPDC127168]|uniref:hypothetical protein n=1 Tax=unclassified Streptomyces TaxID=2593676 RepID=UPI00364104B1